ncbi:unnamed protein product [Paramecium sonneborni]|uniref:Uncharacterized protein n=1 Tax=Paramecium sonneborni TaxID=65129 RepID=A0A8S1MRJ5_9CILI|nr:unnamed protein product [Paramecium sonneborni]
MGQSCIHSSVCYQKLIQEFKQQIIKKNAISLYFSINNCLLSVFIKINKKIQQNYYIGTHQINQAILFEYPSSWLVVVSNLLEFKYVETLQETKMILENC